MIADGTNCLARELYTLHMDHFYRNPWSKSLIVALALNTRDDSRSDRRQIQIANEATAPMKTSRTRLAIYSRAILVKKTAIYFLLALLVNSVACTPTNNSAESQQRLEGQGFARVVTSRNWPGWDILVGPGLLFLTQGISSKTPCEGAVGSILPPLSFTQCAIGVLTLPLVGLEQALGVLSGQRDPYERHIMLAGVERFWVRQTQQNDCWAAALQTTRDYMGFHHVSQEDMIDRTHAVCPALRTQRQGADAYQIAFAISSVLPGYDMARTNPHFCSDPLCVINSLASRHPLILLGGGHAVVLIGLDYTVRPTTNGSGPVIVFERLYVLDPATTTPEIETWSPFTLCKVDALLAY